MNPGIFFIAFYLEQLHYHFFVIRVFLTITFFLNTGHIMIWMKIYWRSLGFFHNSYHSINGFHVLKLVISMKSMLQWILWTCSSTFVFSTSPFLPNSKNFRVVYYNFSQLSLEMAKTWWNQQVNSFNAPFLPRIWRKVKTRNLEHKMLWFDLKCKITLIYNIYE